MYADYKGKIISYGSCHAAGQCRSLGCHVGEPQEPPHSRVAQPKRHAISVVSVYLPARRAHMPALARAPGSAPDRPLVAQNRNPVHRVSETAMAVSLKAWAQHQLQ